MMTKTNSTSQYRPKLRPKRKLKLASIFRQSSTHEVIFSPNDPEEVLGSIFPEQSPPLCAANSVKPESDSKPDGCNPSATVPKTSQPLCGTFKLNPILEPKSSGAQSNEPKLNLLPMFGIPVELEFSLPTSIFGVPIDPNVVADANRYVIDHFNSMDLNEVIKDQEVKYITFEPVPYKRQICCIYKPELAYKPACLSADLIRTVNLMLKLNPHYRVIVHDCLRPKKISMGFPQRYDPCRANDITPSVQYESNYSRPMIIHFLTTLGNIDEREQMEQVEKMRPPELQMCIGIYLYEQELPPGDPRYPLGVNHALPDETEDELKSTATPQDSTDDVDEPYIDDSQVENIKFIPLPFLNEIYCISNPGLVFKEKVFDPDELELFKYILESNTRFRVIVRMCKRPKQSQLDIYQKDLVDVDTVLREYDFTDKMVKRLSQREQKNSKFVFWSHSKVEEQSKPIGEHLCYGVYLYEEEKCCCITCLTKELSIKTYTSTMYDELVGAPKIKPMKYNIAVPIGNPDKDPVSAFLASVASMTTTQCIDLI